MTNTANTVKILKTTSLFKGLNDEEIISVLNCLNAREAVFEQGNIIFNSGGYIKEAGVVMSGEAQVVREDYWGNRSIISNMTKGEIFGEVYAYLDMKLMENTVYAAEKTIVLFIDMKKVITLCSNNCVFHQKLVDNTVRVLAEKNIMLMQKITDISQRTTRQKVLSFLSCYAEKKGNPYFAIPFSRQEMADYLSVDRSALSKELSKMKEEKVIDFEKNNFRILK